MLDEAAVKQVSLFFFPSLIEPFTDQPFNCLHAVVHVSACALPWPASH